MAIQYTKEESKQIAETILQQLGGNYFIAMTGARSFCFDNGSLTFRLPAPAGLRAFGIQIQLTPLDLYDVTFIRMQKDYSVDKETIDRVYCDQLCDLIEKKTGLRTSL
jgi:hypothetical protein